MYRETLRTYIIRDCLKLKNDIIYRYFFNRNYPDLITLEGVIRSREYREGIFEKGASPR